MKAKIVTSLLIGMLGFIAVFAVVYTGLNTTEWDIISKVMAYVIIPVLIGSCISYITIEVWDKK